MGQFNRQQTPFRVKEHVSWRSKLLFYKGRSFLMSFGTDLAAKSAGSLFSPFSICSASVGQLNEGNTDLGTISKIRFPSKVNEIWKATNPRVYYAKLDQFRLCLA